MKYWGLKHARTALMAAYLVTAGAFFASLLAVFASGLANELRTSFPQTLRVTAVLFPAAAAVAATREVESVLRGRPWSSYRGFRAVLIAGSLALLVAFPIAVPAANLLAVVLGLCFLAVTTAGKSGHLIVGFAVVLLSALARVGGSALYSWIVLSSGAVALGLRVVATVVLEDAAEQTRLLNQARTAASTLSDVVMRVERTVHRARVYERSQERRRLAREIHDSIGYTLTGVIVQLGVIATLVSNDEACRRLRSLEEIARKALHDVRREVGALREEIPEEEAAPYRQRWIQVCDYFADFTGTRVDHQIAENLAGVPADLGDMCYRIIQEGLTNAYRHGEATIVDVAMKWKEERRLILLRISDNGRGLDKLHTGNGLNGIRERVEACGGSVVYLSEPGRGFDLGVDLPWIGPATEAAAGVEEERWNASVS